MENDASLSDLFGRLLGGCPGLWLFAIMNGIEVPEVKNYVLFNFWGNLYALVGEV